MDEREREAYCEAMEGYCDACGARLDEHGNMGCLNEEHPENRRVYERCPECNGHGSCHLCFGSRIVSRAAGDI